MVAEEVAAGARGERQIRVNMRMRFHTNNVASVPDKIVRRFSWESGYVEVEIPANGLHRIPRSITKQIPFNTLDELQPLLFKALKDADIRVLFS